MPTSGSKIEIADRIAYFLDTEKIKAASAKRKKATAMFDICEDTKIKDDFVCSEKHRAFFREPIKKRLQRIIKLLRIRKKEKQKLISSSSITLIFETFLRIIRGNP